MSSIPISKVAKLPAKDWQWIGDRLIASIKHNVQKLRYFKDEPYKTHPPFWFTKVIKGKPVRIYAEDYPTRKKKDKAAPKGVSQASTSPIPDLTLTGKMMKGLEPRHHDNDGVTVGWLANDAAKVEWNADMGRAITTKSEPLIPPVDKELQVDIDAKYADRVKLIQGTTNINLKL